MKSNAHHSRAGFTLTELVVAVGVVGLLTLAIGQIFASVSQLTSVGTAIAEVDGIARQMESRLREDFAALARMSSSDTYVAIRWREVGDLDRNGTADLNADEEELYVTPDDEELDRKDGVSRPYEVIDANTYDEVRSRAITTRIDEISFLGLSRPEAPYRSVQTQPDTDQMKAPTARAARIYWGHALRPRQRQSAQTPEREYVPDGDFGWGARSYDGTPRLYNTPLNGVNGVSILNDPFPPSGRNKYAGEWTLARQTLVLYGGTAAGVVDPAVTGIIDTPIGRDREYAPYISDVVSAARYSTLNLLPGNVLGLQPVRPGVGPRDEFQTEGLGDNRLVSDPRAIGGGRVDICAQDEFDIRSMVEGQAAGTPQTGFGPYTGQTYHAGRLSGAPIHYNDVGSVLSSELIRPIWWRADAQAGVTPGFLWGQLGSIDQIVYQNTIVTRSILAGTIQRLLIDDGNKGRPRVWYSARNPPEPAPNPPVDAPEDAMMDLHAAFAPRCSRFEVAWSDGSTVTNPNGVDLNGDGQVDLRTGEMVWFDYSPVLRPDGTPMSFAGRTMRHSYFDLYFMLGTSSGISFKSGDPTLEPTFPEIMPNLTGGGLPNLLNQSGTTNPVVPSAYYRSITGGAPQPDMEAFAIWGFREATPDGNWGRAWPKPRFIRIRATLHDSQFRLPGGKTFEWVFEIRPGAEAGASL